MRFPVCALDRRHIVIALSNEPMPSGAGAVLRVEGPLTISCAAALCATMREAIAGGATAFDLRDVSECDSAGVQLLLAAQRSAETRNTRLRFFHATEAVRDSLSRYALVATPSTQRAEP